MQKSYQPIWILENIFPGGSKSPEFIEFLQQLEIDVRRFAEKCKAGSGDSDAMTFLTGLTSDMQSISQRIREADSYIACLTAERMDDRHAVVLGGESERHSCRLRILANLI